MLEVVGGMRVICDGYSITEEGLGSSDIPVW